MTTFTNALTAENGLMSESFEMIQAGVEANGKLVRIRFAMALIFGMIIPFMISSAWSPVAALIMSGAMLCMYLFAKLDSEAATFGAFLSLITSMLLIGAIEVADATAKAVEIMPAW